MAGSLVVSWSELISIGVFGVVCVVSAARIDEYVRDDLPDHDPEIVQTKHKIPSMQSELSTMEQQLIALRGQAIASHIEAQRRSAEMRVLEAHDPTLRLRRFTLPDPAISDGLLDEVPAPGAKAYDKASVAREASSVLAEDLEREIAGLDARRHEKTTKLAAAQKQARKETASVEKELGKRRMIAFLWLAAPALLFVTLVAGIPSTCLLPKGRRRSSWRTVAIAVFTVALVALGYYLAGYMGAPYAGAASGAVASLTILMLAAQRRPGAHHGKVATGASVYSTPHQETRISAVESRTP